MRFEAELRPVVVSPFDSVAGTLHAPIPLGTMLTAPALVVRGPPDFLSDFAKAVGSGGAAGVQSGAQCVQVTARDNLWAACLSAADLPVLDGRVEARGPEDAMGVALGVGVVLPFPVWTLCPQGFGPTAFHRAYVYLDCGSACVPPGCSVHVVDPSAVEGPAPDSFLTLLLRPAPSSQVRLEAGRHQFRVSDTVHEIFHGVFLHLTSGKIIRLTCEGRDGTLHEPAENAAVAVFSPPLPRYRPIKGGTDTRTIDITVDLDATATVTYALLFSVERYYNAGMTCVCLPW